jgi:hypothetical protein
LIRAHVRDQRRALSWQTIIKAAAAKAAVKVVAVRAAAKAAVRAAAKVAVVKAAAKVAAVKAAAKAKKSKAGRTTSVSRPPFQDETLSFVLGVSFFKLQSTACNGTRR